MTQSLKTFFLSALGMFLGYGLAQHSTFFTLATARAQPTSDIITTKALELVNAQGQRQFLLAATGEGSPALWFFDKNGKSRLNIGLYGDNNAFIVLNDENEQAVQIFRTVGPTNAPVLVMKSKGQDRIILGLNGPKMDPFFVYYDDKAVKKTVFGNY